MQEFILQIRATVGGLWVNHEFTLAQPRAEALRQELYQRGYNREQVRVIVVNYKPYHPNYQ